MKIRQQLLNTCLFLVLLGALSACQRINTELAEAKTPSDNPAYTVKVNPNQPPTQK